MMLEYKWGYGDGQITDWRRSDLEDLMLGYFPREVALEDEDLLSEAARRTRFNRPITSSPEHDLAELGPRDRRSRHMDCESYWTPPVIAQPPSIRNTWPVANEPS